MDYEEIKKKFEETGECEWCEGVGEESFDENDNDGNLQSGVGTRKCSVCNGFGTELKDPREERYVAGVDEFDNSKNNN